MKNKLIVFIFLIVCSARAWDWTNIFIGTTPRDGTGDKLPLAMAKVNTNLYWATNQFWVLSNNVNQVSNLVAHITAGSGVTATDGTCTNAFAVVYSVAPVVSVSQFGVARSATNAVVSITTTNFVYTANKPAVSNLWTAIGQ